MNSAINYEMFSKNIENRDRQRVCRFCLVDAKSTQFVDVQTIAQLFKEITNDDLSFSLDHPTLVCITCEENLRKAAKIRSDLLQMEMYWKKYVEEMSLIESIKIEVIEDTEMTFETVEMTIEPMYSSSSFDYDMDVNIKSDFSTKDEEYIFDENSIYNTDSISDFGDSHQNYGESTTSQSKNVCPYCKLTNMTASELKAHREICFSDIRARQFRCDICQKTYSSEHGIRRHMNRHVALANVDRTMRYKCSSCDKSFCRKVQLVDHELTHSGVAKLHVCHICGISKKSRSSINVHLKSHDPNFRLQKKTELSKAKSKRRYYTCWMCPSRIDFKCLEELKSHRKNLHHDFQCKFCKNGFMTNEALESHMLIHGTQERPHVCKICGGTFSKIGHLNSHIQGKHAVQKPHPCDKCPKGFVHRYQLQSHIRISHDKIKAFHCTECPLTFGHAKSKVWHMRAVHNM